MAKLIEMRAKTEPGENGLINGGDFPLISVGLEKEVKMNTLRNPVFGSRLRFLIRIAN